MSRWPVNISDTEVEVVRLVAPHNVNPIGTLYGGSSIYSTPLILSTSFEKSSDSGFTSYTALRIYIYCCQARPRTMDVAYASNNADVIDASALMKSAGRMILILLDAAEPSNVL